MSWLRTQDGGERLVSTATTDAKSCRCQKYSLVSREPPGAKEDGNTSTRSVTMSQTESGENGLGSTHSG